MNVCPSCGTPNPVSAKFCQECGTRLTPAESIDTTPSPVAPEPADEPSSASTAAPEQEPVPASATTDDEETGSDQPGESDRPKKDVSGLPPSWMPAPVTLTMKPSGQRSAPAAPPPPVATTPPPPVREEHTEPGELKDVPADSDAPPAKDVSGLPPSWMPAPVDLSAPRPFEHSGVDPDWKMSDAGPLPERRDRRLWLWIPVGLITAVLICCIAFFLWATTIGEDTVDGWATNAAVNQTEEATNGD